MAETEFVRIKRAVEQAKTKKMQEEARISSLEAEKARVLDDVKELTGKELKTAEEVEAFAASMKDEIENKITEMRTILTEEEVSF